MGRRKKEAPEQKPLIDVLPDNQKTIKTLARKYKAAMQERQACLKEEVDLKHKLLEEVKKANLQPVDGKISLRIDDLQITVTPRDELVRVKDAGDDDSDDEGDE
jgi:hypothetical protein